MPLDLRLHLVMMSKYSKFGVDTLKYFLSNGLHYLHNVDNYDLAIPIARLFLRNTQTKNETKII